MNRFKALPSSQSELFLFIYLFIYLFVWTPEGTPERDNGQFLWSHLMYTEILREAYTENIENIIWVQPLD